MKNLQHFIPLLVVAQSSAFLFHRQHSIIIANLHITYNSSINLFMTQQRLFPLRLPPNFHGTPRPFRRPAFLSRQLSQNPQNTQYSQRKIGHWQLKRSDREVEAERRTFLVHTSKISNDSPEWFKTTLHYFRRDNYHSRTNNSHVQHTGLGRPSQNPFGHSTLSSRVPRESPVSGKVNARDVSLTGVRWNPNKSEVTTKVGSVQLRDYSIRKPQLKIGVSGPENFVNTYSVF